MGQRAQEFRLLVVLLLGVRKAPVPHHFPAHEHRWGTTIAVAEAARPRCGRRHGAGDGRAGGGEKGWGDPRGPYRAPCPGCALTWHRVLQHLRGPWRQAHFGAALPPSWRFYRNQAIAPPLSPRGRIADLGASGQDPRRRALRKKSCLPCPGSSPPGCTRTLILRN